MRKLRLIKVVVPEIVAYFSQGSEPMKPEYECSTEWAWQRNINVAHTAERSWRGSGSGGHRRNLENC